MQRYDDFLADPGLVVIALDAVVLDRAAELRARWGLRTPDALQAASSLESDERGYFVTGDSDFEVIPDLRVHRVAMER